MSRRLHSRPKTSRGLTGRKASAKPPRKRSGSKPSGSTGPKRQKGPSRLSRAARVVSRGTLLIVPARVRPTPGSTSRRGVRSKDRSTLTLARRNRIPLALAAVFSFTILLTSFPASALLAQHRQLSAATDQLHGLQSENRALAEQEQQLNSNAAINRLARQDYQLILPGQTLYDVLPPSGKSATATPGGPVSGDPGNQPLVAPADAPDMSPDPGLSQPTTSKPGTTASGSGAAKSGTAGSVATGSAATAPTRPGFMSRVTNTLEFWK